MVLAIDRGGFKPDLDRADLLGLCAYKDYFAILGAPSMLLGTEKKRPSCLSVAFDQATW